jgi:hypothetical protein
MEGSGSAMDSWIRALKIFCVVAGIVLVLGTGTLVWLLVQRQKAREAAAPPPTAMLDLRLPEGLRIAQTAFDGSRLVLLLDGPDRQQYLALVNPTTGERLSLLRVVAEPPSAGP